MHRSGWTPSIVPREDDQAVYLVMDDRGERGQVWTEADATSDLEAVIQDMLAGQYSNPVRVVGFQTAEGWSRDVSADVAQELRQRCDLQLRDVPFFCSRLSIVMRADTTMSSFHCQSGWRERGAVQRRPSGSDREAEAGNRPGTARERAHSRRIDSAGQSSKCWPAWPRF